MLINIIINNLKHILLHTGVTASDISIYVNSNMHTIHTMANKLDYGTGTLQQRADSIVRMVLAKVDK